MSAPVRLALYGVALAVVFALAWLAGDLLLPEGLVHAWGDRAH